MPDRCVFNLPVAGCERADHDFAGVYADANLDRCAPFGLEPRAIFQQLFLHPQPGIERALRVVLVGERCTEHREDAVAGRLHDVAVVAMDRCDHQLESGIDDGASFLRVEVLLQFGRALDIGKQSAVTVLRSPSIGSGSELLRVTLITGGVEPDVASEGCPACPFRAIAHCVQNLASSGLSKAHFWHLRLKGVAH